MSSKSSQPPVSSSKKRKSSSSLLINQPTLETYSVHSSLSNPTSLYQPTISELSKRPRTGKDTTLPLLVEANFSYTSSDSAKNTNNSIGMDYGTKSASLSPSFASSSSSSSSSLPNGAMSVHKSVSSTTSGPGRQQPKKLVIKSFKTAPKLPENYFDITWSMLQTAVRAIHNSQPVTDSLEALYKSVENLCHHKMGDALYERLRAECDAHILDELHVLRRSQIGGQDFLKMLNECWQAHCRQMLMIRSIFLYLDRTYVLQTAGVNSLWDMGLDLFRTHVMCAVDIKKKSLDECLKIIDKDRDGEMIDTLLLKSLLRMYVDLNIYTHGFQEFFLDSTQRYYHREGDRLVNELEVPMYLNHVDKRLKEEGTDRILMYLDKSSRVPVVKVVEQELLDRWVSILLEKGFDDLMNADAKDNLALMYRLLERVSALDRLKLVFAAYIKKTGSAIVQDPTREAEMVQSLLDFKARMDGVLTDSFGMNEAFSNVLKESFESFVNSRQNKPAELIAKFLDSMLRSGNKSNSDEELESILDRVLILFRFIQGKDVFEAFYKRDLAKRLLLGKSASVDAEKSMLSKLKTECGAGFTSKLEGMFKDIDISREFMASYRTSKSHDQLHDVELYVNVLTQGFWPTYPPAEVTIPPQMAQYMEYFQNFYLSKHSGRRLVWQNSLGHCVLKASFPKGLKELSVSLFQAVVLLLFNDTARKTVSYKEIKQETNIEDRELIRTLQSLSVGKVRVLHKTHKGKDVTSTDEFYFNEEFHHPLFRIKVNAIQLKETVEENKETNERVFADRQYQVDAAIVRIMKTRKTLTHNLLMNELFEQLRFPIKASDLKKRIESLIDREYLERGAEKDVYNYLA